MGYSIHSHKEIKMEKQTRLSTGKKHSQDWSKYNLAKTNEKRLFYELLYELVNVIEEPKHKLGRPPVPLRDLIFCGGLKLYSNYSGRKAVSDYRFALEAGWISRSPHFNTLKDFMNCEAVYDLLKRLLTITAMPLRTLENHYSLDSSGFGTYTKERWNRVKWGKNFKHKDYLKGHILIGTKTNIICNVEITPGNFNDAAQAPKLIMEADSNFKMQEFSADKAYGSQMIYRVLESLKVTPYIPFKINSITNKGKPMLWKKMFKIFKENREEFDEHYHQRSNVETVFAMIKRRLGEHLLSKNYYSQRNELLLKMISHNICCLIQESYERGVEIDFRDVSVKYTERKVPKEFIIRDASKVQNRED